MFPATRDSNIKFNRKKYSLTLNNKRSDKDSGKQTRKVKMFALCCASMNSPCHKMENGCLQSDLEESLEEFRPSPLKHPNDVSYKHEI